MRNQASSTLKMSDSDWSDGFPEETERIQLESSMVMLQALEGRPFESPLPIKNPMQVAAARQEALALLNEFKTRSVLVQSQKYQDDLTPEQEQAQNRDT